jgi:hypothetical protein
MHPVYEAGVPTKNTLSESVVTTGNIEGVR